MLQRFISMVTLAVVAYVIYLGLVPGVTDVILQDKPKQQSVIEDFVWAVTEGVATGDVGQKVAEEASIRI